MDERQAILDQLNNSGLVQQLNNLQLALMYQSARRSGLRFDDPTNNAEEETQLDRTKFILNSCGAGCLDIVVPMTINHMQRNGMLKVDSVLLNGDPLHNMEVIHNNSVEEASNFTNVARQFLLPRYAYLDFDTIIDPRHHIDAECGYPKFITPIMYRYMYDRDDVMRRVVDLYADETWAEDPVVSDSENEYEETPFNLAWWQLRDDYNIMQYMYRIDKLAGVGHYGALLMGIADGADLEKPIQEPELLAGIRRSVSTQPRPLLFLRPFDEYLSFIHMYETDVLHPRYGLPKFYNLVFLDMTIDAAGASIGTRLNRRVHWTRVIHVPDNLQSSLVFGTPRAQPVFNRLLDLRKIKGGSAEMFWKGAFPGLSFEAMPNVIDTNPEYNHKEFREMLERYSGGLQRYLDTVGITVKSLAPQVADPDKHVRVQLEAISAFKNCPFRVFMGSEEGKLAGSEDRVRWNNRLQKNSRRFTIPYVVRNIIDRFVAIGVMPPPRNGRYTVEWPSFHATTEEEKANLGLKWTQAMAQYVAGGIIHFIQPLDYMTMILGLTMKDAMKVDAYIKENGGYEMLRKVDPSEQTVAGDNGVRKNTTTKGQKEGNTGARDKERNTADKKTEGSSS